MLDVSNRTRKMMETRGVEDSYFDGKKRSTSRRNKELDINDVTVESFIAILASCPKDATFFIHSDDDYYGGVLIMRWNEPETDDEFVRRIIKQDELEIQVKRINKTKQEKELKLLQQLKKKYPDG